MILPRAFMIDDAAKEIATQYWKDSHFNRILAVHKHLDDWKLEGASRTFIKKMLVTDVAYYLKYAPESLDLPNFITRFIMFFVNAFDNTLEWISDL